MGTATLVEADVDLGRKAYTAIRKAGIQADVALWRYDHQANNWRFVLALPRLESSGARTQYERIRAALAKEQVDLPTWRITLLSSSDPVANWAKHQKRHRDWWTTSGDVVDGITVEGAYIYRSA